ncbi:hypothetical protein DSL64_05170 [Dyadobacter luteus]|uniref:DNA-binding response regulator n=1 Tax=Dyadobacter luteus TaxID=2259619 RepID=A0A3D8YEJ8_9BACT|nr:response regulator transcription factor [Dyadobacter luteus]REA63016.1 hypothetical protein DSL64_05170 [Dyadobacter luteus]
MKHIVLVESYPIVRAGIAMLITESMSETYQIHTADSIEKPFPKDPDIIILSVNADAIAELGKKITLSKIRCSKSKLIVFCENMTYTDISNLIASGVSGFVSKRSEFEQLTTCIREIEIREYFFCTELIGLIISRFVSPQNAILPEKRHKLSSREIEIASYLVKGMKTSDIAVQLDRKPTTVSTIKNNIFKKMNVNNVMALNEVMTKLHL